jgi:hypothetical protein
LQADHPARVDGLSIVKKRAAEHRGAGGAILDV